MSVEITMSHDQELKLKALLTSDEAIRREIKQIAEKKGGMGLLDTFIGAAATSFGDAKLEKAMKKLEK